MKLCVDCDHFVAAPFGSPHPDMCGTIRESVRGRPANTASYMRTIGSCGYDGLRFEPKVDRVKPWWAR
jgi:hypothetical protein